MAGKCYLCRAKFKKLSLISNTIALQISAKSEGLFVFKVTFDMNEEEFEPYYCPIHTLVLQDNSLSDAALRLYALYQIKILTSGWIGINDKKAANWLGWSLQKLRKAKKELENKNWIILFTVNTENGKLDVHFTQPQFVKYCNAIEDEVAKTDPNFDPENHGWQSVYGNDIKLGM